jgi:tetratricopeptide (TPR) repeat protein
MEAAILGGAHMRMRRVLAISAVSVAVALALGPGSPRAEAPGADRLIVQYQQMLTRNPLDARSYYRLGDAYVQKARESADFSYFALAERALRQALELDPRQAGARRHLAYVLYSRHEFAGAAAEAAEAIVLDPTDSHAYGILGDAYLEMGEYEQAELVYRRMTARAEDLYSLCRLAGLKSFRGDPRGAMDDLERAIRAGRMQGVPAEAIAWVEWQVGSEHWALGEIELAEQRYLRALEALPHYHRALAGLAQVRAAQERYREASDLYRQAIAIIPQPDYVAALGDLLDKIGRPDESAKQYALVEYIGRLSELNKVLYNRELAYFFADHDLKPSEALALAAREFEVRHDIYAYDVLAWALYRNGRSADARAVIGEALKLGTRDARLFYHAGMISLRLGATADAQEYLERALSINPRFHVVHADLARRALEEIQGTEQWRGGLQDGGRPRPRDLN